MNAEDIAAGLVALNDGELVGRTRLQKQAYLLHRCGANLGLRFTYYYYGPYCFELAAGVNDARAEGWVDIEERTGRHGVPYAIFRSVAGSDSDPPDCLGELPADQARDLLRRMKPVSDVVLELAATIVFLRDQWRYFGKDKGRSPIEETKARKSLKATDERIEKALVLLRDLGLWKGPASAAG